MELPKTLDMDHARQPHGCCDAREGERDDDDDDDDGATAVATAAIHLLKLLDEYLENSHCQHVDQFLQHAHESCTAPVGIAATVILLAYPALALFNFCCGFVLLSSDSHFWTAP